jgi:hypothetical protein
MCMICRTSRCSTSLPRGNSYGTGMQRMTRESSLTCQSSCPPDNTSSEWDEWAKPRNKSSHGVSSSSIGTKVRIVVTELESAKLVCCDVPADNRSMRWQVWWSTRKLWVAQPRKRRRRRWIIDCWQSWWRCFLVEDTLCKHRR